MAVVGGVKDIPNSENSLKIIDIAKFAVDDYNEKQNGNLTFVEVKDSKVQVVSGELYSLKIEVTDENKNRKLYEAKVWEQSWLNHKEVKEFNYVVS